MDYAKESLRLHGEWGGKIEVVCTVPCKTKEDLDSLRWTQVLEASDWKARELVSSTQTAPAY